MWNGRGWKEEKEHTKKGKGWKREKLERGRKRESENRAQNSNQLA